MYTAPGPVEGADVSMSDVGNKVEARLMWGPPVVSWCAGPADHYVVQSRTVSDDEQQDRNTFYEEVHTYVYWCMCLFSISIGECMHVICTACVVYV